ncbi:MAG: membrane-bound lytic murein transglycosylase MltF [Rhodanobacteraceae bacterium]
MRGRLTKLGTACALCCLAALVLLVSCSPDAGNLARIHERGTLKVLTLNSPTTWYIGRDDAPGGPEYTMVSAFARSLGVKPVFVVKGSVSELLQALADGKGDMIAAGITRTRKRQQRFDFGPVYQKVRQQVVCRRGGPKPRNVADLQGLQLRVVAQSSYAENLEALRATHPGLRWQVDSKDGTEQLLRQVWRGKLDCTVADSNIVAINRRYFPNLVVAFDISQAQPLAWVLPRKADALRQAMDDWQAQWRAQGQLKRLMTRYYGHAKVFDYVDTREYVRRIQNVFPRYRKLFHQAADAHDLPALVLAAQAYQESHWNPHATSPTGVRGMMMLTRNTAAELDVDNRLDPAESIAGGARYLASLEQRLPDHIPAEDRLWFALAAYNVGLGHVRDARVLADRLGDDPDSWSEVAKVLPLLGKRRYYKTLKHGYARGAEPVRYIRRIRNYADILRHKLQDQSTMVVSR